MDSTIFPDSKSNLFASLGRELASTANAEMAAYIIVDVADKLFGWDACYLILYDPEKNTAPRPLLAIDTIDGKRSVESHSFPKTPSKNIITAIEKGGHLALYDENFFVDPSMSFGNKNIRTLSQMFVPVRNQTRIIGVLSIQNYKKNAYTEGDLSLLKDLADHCAGALERIWAQEALADMAERLKVLHQTLYEISLSLDMEQLCEAIHNAVEKIMFCDDFVIDGYDSETNEIIPIYAVEYPRKRVVTDKYFADHGLAGHIVHNQKSLLLNNRAQMDKSGINFVFYGSGGEEDPTKALIAVPMLLHGRVVGMISAQSHKPDSYTTDDLTLLELLGTHAAIAIENARLFSKAQYLADIDTLTGAFSRRKFYELAEREFNKAVRYHKNLSCIMLDIDNFKSFNDKYGHKVGDHVLRTIADICKKSIREVDIFGRLGGEEFAIILPETNILQAASTSNRLRGLVQNAELSGFEELFDTKAEEKPTNSILKATISIGAAEYSKECESVEMLIDWADQAMYKGKYAGGNQVNLWKTSVE